ncbi:MAG: lyase family protein [Pseudomonadota bacterium]
MISGFDSALTGHLFADGEIARLFSDSAVIRAMLIVEGALAKAQGEVGMIPAESAAFLHRAAMEVSIDPAALADATAQNGVPVPALVAAFRAAMEAPDHAQYAHWGATSQDIVDTAMALRTRQALSLIEARLDAALSKLADLAEHHAETPMVARTWGQAATPTTFGAVVAGWGEGLLAVRMPFDAVRRRVEVVTLNGAAGTAAILGRDAPALRMAMGKALGIAVPRGSGHAERGQMRALANILSELLQAANKPATDLLLLTRDGDVRLGGGGGSSTMPQKSNPVGPSVIGALAAHGVGLAASLQAPHWDQRDGAAWMAEWLALPPLLVATGKVMSLLRDLEIMPDVDIMRARLDDPRGLVHAEAVSFALTKEMSRPDAQARTKALAQEVRASGGNLIDAAGLAREDFTPEQRWGEAPELARAFARAVRDG